MARKKAKYAEVRKNMQPGDVIAFGGKGNFSEIIKWATRSPVSHIGVILQSKLLIDGQPQNGIFNQIIESTALNGFSGVSISRLSDRVFEYGGEIWWLPLSEKTRKKLAFKDFYDFMLHQEHKKYDMPQAVGSALDAMDNMPVIGNLTHNVEDFSRFFCSELAAAGLEAGKAIPSLNASEVTPSDLCRFNIYAEHYHQLKGRAKNINGYNTLSPAGWGQ